MIRTVQAKLPLGGWGEADVIEVSEGDGIIVHFNERGCPTLTFPTTTGETTYTYPQAILLVPKKV